MCLPNGKRNKLPKEFDFLEMNNSKLTIKLLQEIIDYSLFRNILNKRIKYLYLDRKNTI